MVIQAYAMAQLPRRLPRCPRPGVRPTVGGGADGDDRGAMRKFPVAIVTAALLLAGCHAGSTPIAALQAAQSKRDALPAGKAESLGIVPESTHFAAEKYGYAFYLGRRAGGTDS